MIGLPWRPAQLSLAKHVHVQLVHALAAVGAAVDDDTVSCEERDDKAMMVDRSIAVVKAGLLGHCMKQQMRCQRHVASCTSHRPWQPAAGALAATCGPSAIMDSTTT